MTPINISDSEWQVMSVIWEKAPVSAADVVEAVSAEKGWHSRTIRTLLDRLVKKKAIKAGSDGKRKVYEARISRELATRQESRSLLDRVFGGEPVSMLLHLVESAELDADDIKRLKDILSEKEKDK
jgi:predicted transcriptional regulator